MEVKFLLESQSPLVCLGYGSDEGKRSESRVCLQELLFSRFELSQTNLAISISPLYNDHLLLNFVLNNGYPYRCDMACDMASRCGLNRKNHLHLHSVLLFYFKVSSHVSLCLIPS